MNTCPTCPNDLVCHDQGECLRSTPETDAETAHKNDVYEFVDPEWDWVVPADFARRLERERNEAREENARLREALERICAIKNCSDCGDWDEIEEARNIAQQALTP